MTTKRLSAISGVVLAAYFGWLASGAIHAKFAIDDPTNLGYYWKLGFARTALDNFRFWSTAYRPMGGIFYLSIYYLFHLNPLPYRIVILAIIAANIALTWIIADALTGSKAASALASALVCGHAAMVSIYYQNGMIYDILAYFFTALMLAVYLRGRAQDRELPWWRIAAVIGAYIAALDSKEIAVVAAGWVLAYEFLVPKKASPRTAIALVMIGLIFAIGKSIGPDAMSKQPGYALDLSFHRYLLNNSLYFNSLFYSRYYINWRRFLIAWGLLTVAVAAVRKREVWWCWFLVSTATLATSFTIVARDAGALYVPLLAWALLVSTVVAVLARRPAFAWVTAAVIMALWGRQTIHLWRHTAPLYADVQKTTWSAISQMRELPHPAPRSRVAILNSPFGGWDAYFIAELTWNDPSIYILMADKLPAPLNAEDLKTYDWVLAFDREKLRVVRRP